MQEEKNIRITMDIKFEALSTNRLCFSGSSGKPSGTIDTKASPIVRMSKALSDGLRVTACKRHNSFAINLNKIPRGIPNSRY